MLGSTDTSHSKKARARTRARTRARILARLSRVCGSSIALVPLLCLLLLLLGSMMAMTMMMLIMHMRGFDHPHGREEFGGGGLFGVEDSYVWIKCI